MLFALMLYIQDVVAVDVVDVLMLYVGEKKTGNCVLVKDDVVDDVVEWGEKKKMSLLFVQDVDVGFDVGKEEVLTMSAG